MKTRVFHTRFWQDSYILSLDINEKLLFTYLITNQEGNLIGCYELSDDVIQFNTRLNKSEIARIKGKFENDCKIIFAGDWLYLVNHSKYQEYNSTTHLKAVSRQWSLVPDFMKSKLESLSIGNLYPIDTSKDKRPKIKDKRQKIKEGVKGEIVTEKEINARWFLEVWNFVFGTKLSSTVAIEDNLEFWLKHYSKEEIKLAVINARKDKFWKNKINPEIFLRQKNDRHERVDRIASFLHRKTTITGANVNLK